jgi:acetolactate synthase-1/2/3 large subunit
VIALEAAGSGLYTVQALWTQAREGLKITTVVCANHGHRILQLNSPGLGRRATRAGAARLTDWTIPGSTGSAWPRASACRPSASPPPANALLTLAWALSEGAHTWWKQPAL